MAGTAVSSDVRDVAPGLWIWPVEHEDWSEGYEWGPTVWSTCVESGGEVALVDPIAPVEESDVWTRLDAKPPTLAAVLKPDHVRDVDLFVQRYGVRACGPHLFWRDNIPETSSRASSPATSCRAVSSRSTTGAAAARRRSGSRSTARSSSRTG